jgi:hypothetical protein
MTLAGWLLMLGSVSAVVALNVFCFYRVFKAPVTKDHLHAPLDIDTHEKLE